MPTIYINKYIDWTKDLTYQISDRKDLDYFTQKEISDEEFAKLSDDVKTNVEEIKNLINNII